MQGCASRRAPHNWHSTSIYEKHVEGITYFSFGRVRSLLGRGSASIRPRGRSRRRQKHGATVENRCWHGTRAPGGVCAQFSDALGRLITSLQGYGHRDHSNDFRASDRDRGAGGGGHVGGPVGGSGPGPHFVVAGIVPPNPASVRLHTGLGFVHFGVFGGRGSNSGGGGT